MIKKILITAILLLSSSQLFASTYTLHCIKTKSLASFYHQDAASLSCDGMSTETCRNVLSTQLENKYGSLSSACAQILGSGWYYDTLKWNS